MNIDLKLTDIIRHVSSPGFRWYFENIDIHWIEEEFNVCVVYYRLDDDGRIEEIRTKDTAVVTDMQNCKETGRVSVFKREGEVFTLSLYEESCCEKYVLVEKKVIESLF